MLSDDYSLDLRPDQSVSPFADSISSLAWSPVHNRIFASTCWSGDLRAYQIFQTDISQRFHYQFPSPAVKCTWNDQGSQLFVGLVDGTVRGVDLNSGAVAEVGRLDAPISSLHFLPGRNALVVSGYQSSIQVLQLGTPKPVMTVNAENKVYATDVSFPTLAACMANERILLADLGNPNVRQVLDSTDLGKGSQLQCIALSAGSKGVVMGVASFDGRANISSLTRNIQQKYITKSAITFKSNKQEANGLTTLFPINAVSFNPNNQRWFLTAGSDGVMHFWDYEAKNRIKSLNYNGYPICAARLNSAGDMIAYALGNDWHVGEEGAKWETKLGVHIITDSEKRFHK